MIGTVALGLVIMSWGLFFMSGLDYFAGFLNGAGVALVVYGFIESWKQITPR